MAYEQKKYFHYSECIFFLLSIYGLPFQKYHLLVKPFLNFEKKIFFSEIIFQKYSHTFQYLLIEQLINLLMNWLYITNGETNWFLSASYILYVNVLDDHVWPSYPIMKDPELIGEHTDSALTSKGLLFIQCQTQVSVSSHSVKLKSLRIYCYS